MGHTFDTKNTTGLSANNPCLISITPTSGATLLVLSIFNSAAQPDPRQGGAPSFNGENMTIAGTICPAIECGCEMWYLINPSIGTYNVSVPNTSSRTLALTASVYKAQAGYTSVFDGVTQSFQVSANPSLSITPSEDGAVIVDTLADGDSSVPTGHNQTLLYSTDRGSESDSHQYALQATAAEITFSWTVPSDDWCMVLAAFIEESAGPVGHPWFYERKQ